MECFSTLKAAGNSAILNNMDGAEGHYTKWNKPCTETQIMYDVIYTWNLKQSNSEAESTWWLSRVGGRKIWGDVGQRVQFQLCQMNKFRISNEILWILQNSSFKKDSFKKSCLVTLKAHFFFHHKTWLIFHESK